MKKTTLVKFMKESLLKEHIPSLEKMAAIKSEEEIEHDVKRDLSIVAGEEIDAHVYFDSGDVSAYGSEMACYRISYKYSKEGFDTNVFNNTEMKKYVVKIRHFFQ